jgi:inositol phosphorylceramide synthase catalytic subunit
MGSQHSHSLYNKRSILGAAICTVVYLLLSWWLIGFKTDQLFLAAVFNACYFATATSRQFILGFSIFIVYWIIFDYMKAIPNYKVNEVHIADLYAAEKKWFGISEAGKLLTPNEFWEVHQRWWLDLAAGIFYLCWIPVPLAFAAYLFFKNKPLFLQFSLTFVLINMLGFVVYYIYPAAPPWFVQQYGIEFLPGTPGNTAGLSRFDSLTGTSIFKSLYAKGSNVFAAMPSLHSAYPVAVLYYGLKNKSPWWVNLFFGMVMLGIWSAAVYSSHHYILDVLAGICTAIIGIVLFQYWIMQRQWFHRFYTAMLGYIGF